MEIALSELEEGYSHFGFSRTPTTDMVEFENMSTGDRFFHSPVDEGVDFDLAHIIYDIAQYDLDMAQQLGEYLIGVKEHDSGSE